MSAHDLHVLVDTLAWSLIHFLWQGALVALVLWLGLAALGNASARARYLVRCAALVAMAAAPVATFAWLWGDAPELPSVVTSAGLALPEAVEGAAESLWSQPLAWVVLGWCAGAALCVLRFGGGLLQVVRLRRKSVGIDLAPRWQRRFDALAREFGVRATARVVESAAVCVPAVIGCVKPVVLLPARLFSGLSDEQIEALVAHELAHVVRHDYLVNIAQSIVEALLFYHPAVWWVSRGIRVEREYCCDDLAVAATRNGLSYAHALATLEAWRGAQPQLGVSTLGGSLLSRIQRLVGLEPERPRRALRPAHAVAGLFVAGTLGASAFAFATQPEPASCDCKCACHRKVHAQDRAVDVLEDVTVMPVPSGRAIHSRVPIVDYHFGADAPQDDQRVRVIVKTIDSNGNETTSERFLGGDESGEWVVGEAEAPRAKTVQKRFVVRTDLDQVKHLQTDAGVELEGNDCVFFFPSDGQDPAAVDPRGQDFRLLFDGLLEVEDSGCEGEGEGCDPAPRATLGWSLDPGTILELDGAVLDLNGADSPARAKASELRLHAGPAGPKVWRANVPAPADGAQRVRVHLLEREGAPAVEECEVLLQGCDVLEDCEVAEECTTDPFVRVPMPAGTVEDEHGFVIQVVPRVVDGSRIELETVLVKPDQQGVVHGDLEGVHEWITKLESAPELAPHPARALLVERLLHGTEADTPERMQKLHDVLIEAGPDGFDRTAHIEVARKALTEQAKLGLEAHVEALKQKGDLEAAERVRVKLKELGRGEHEVVDLAVPQRRALLLSREAKERAALDRKRVREAERADLESELKALRAKLEALESELAKRRAAEGGAR